MFGLSRLIPAENIPAIEARINKTNSKSRRGKISTPPMVLELPQDAPKVFEPVAPIQPKGSEIPQRYAEYNWVSLIGVAPVLDGWAFDCRYEFEKTDGGEAICFAHAAPGVELGPDFRDIEAHRCDHCGTRRYRTLSYLVRNVETGERMVVGRSCLKDFFPGKTPAEILRTYSYTSDALAYFSDDSLSIGSGCAASARVRLNEFTHWVASVYRVSGKFVSRSAANEYGTNSTADLVRYLLNPRPAAFRGNDNAGKDWDEARALYKPTEADHEMARTLIDLALNMEIDGDYTDKLNKVAKVGWLSAQNEALWVSVLTVYARQERKAAKEVAQEAKKALPAVEEGKRRIDGEIVKVNQVEDTFNPYGGYINKITIQDADGNQYYGTSPKALGEPKVAMVVAICATVKRASNPGFAFFSRPRVAKGA